MMIDKSTMDLVDILEGDTIEIDDIEGEYDMQDHDPLPYGWHLLEIPMLL